MENLAVLGALAVLWLVVAPVLALVIARRASHRADLLAIRLQALEAALRERPAGPAAPNPWTAPAERPAAAVPIVPAARVEEARPEPAQDASTPPLPPPPAPSVPPTPPRESLETRLGARWSVLVGGLALALGAVFLVRYSIEQGLLGPRMRIALGVLLSAALFAAGEWLRRRDRELRLPVFARADVPAILTAAGGIGLFATIFAAHSLYGFIGPAAAFVLLTAAGLVTLVLSVIHGPALAALGALGSYASPLLVSSADPQALPVALHTLVVTAAVLAMARIRGWTWLAIAGVGASLAWGVLVAGIEVPGRTAAEIALVAGLVSVFVGAFAVGLAPAGLADRRPNLHAAAALAGAAILHVVYVLADPFYPTLVAGILLTGALGAAASAWTPLAPVALLGGVVAVATVVLIPGPPPEESIRYGIGGFFWNVGGAEGLPRFAPKAFVVAALVGIGGFLSADRAAAPAPRSAGYLAGAGAFAPLAILIVVYLRNVPFETRPLIGLAALVLAALFAAMTERLIRRRPADDGAPAPALYAAGAVLALSFAMAVGLATRYLPLAFALGAAGIVWVRLHRPVRLLVWLAVVSAAFAAISAVVLPYDAAEIGTRPFLNGLVLRLGLPAAALLLAGEVLRRREDGIPAAILQTVGLVFLASFVSLEIHHFATGGVLRRGISGLGEQGALTMAALAFSLGLQRIAGRTGSRIYTIGSLVAGVIGAVMIALGHFVARNPLLTGEPTGTGHVFNLLVPGYLLPAVLAAVVAAAARPVRPRWYVLMAASLSHALAFAYVTLVVRHAFWGAILDRPRMLDAENWTYSAAWLLFGAALLVVGIFVRSALVRAASGLVIALVVCKVFLLDMSALTGALRAASFIGLGLALILIGRLYQRLLTRTAEAPQAA